MSSPGWSRRMGMRKVSKKQRSRLAKYYRIREAYLRANPLCMICKCEFATDIHHRKGRVGSLLCDTKWWMALCRVDHDKVHNNVAWAKEKGYLVPYWK